MVLAETAPDRKRTRTSVPAPEKPHQGVFGNSKLTALGSLIYVNQYYEINLTTGTETTHYYLGGRQVAYKKGDTLEYVHQDHLGSTSLVTGTDGAQVSTVKYFPFGGIRAQTGAPGTDKLFTGQRLDQTGLYFYNARYYDATIGRFISADTIVPDPTNPQSLNRYSYCLNNPLKYVDPSGHFLNLTQEEIEQWVIDNPDDPSLTDEGREFARANADKRTSPPDPAEKIVTDRGGHVEATGGIGVLSRSAYYVVGFLIVAGVATYDSATNDKSFADALKEGISDLDYAWDETWRVLREDYFSEGEAEYENEALDVDQAPKERTTSDKIKDIQENPEDWDKIASRNDPKQPKDGSSYRELYRHRETGELLERHVLERGGQAGKNHPHYKEPDGW